MSVFPICSRCSRKFLHDDAGAGHYHELSQRAGHKHPSLHSRAVSVSSDPRYLAAVKVSQESYKQQLSETLESIAVVFASTRVFMDLRIFLYRFTDNRSRVVSHGNGKGSFLIDRVTNEAPSQSVGQQWH